MITTVTTSTITSVTTMLGFGMALGVVAVVDEHGALSGCFSNGDLGRVLEKGTDIWHLTARDVMMRDPKTIDAGRLCGDAVQKMQRHSITALFIVDEERRPVGIVHMHDLLRTEPT